ncbi:hypothetical protein VNI00_007305 [Paramarasmius palmivorus]|uniref:HMG box domain-containing protein n=1 Tax=Paramarasmius palmivorus TaxID=297713 RepID=A0AAW0D580_9AGAR
MVRLRSNNDRLLSSTRRVGTTTRKPWRRRTKRVRPKLTKAQKRDNKKKREDDLEEYQGKIATLRSSIVEKAQEINAEDSSRSVDRIIDDVYQTHRLKNKKTASQFNAFTKMELKAINDALPEGEPKKKANECMKEISLKWNAIPIEDREALTAGTLKEILENRKNREVGSHNSALSAFHDTRTCIDDVKDKLTRLNARTGDESVLLVSRSSSSHYNKPMVFGTSERALEFFNLVFELPVEELAQRYEGYTIAGVGQVARTAGQKLLEAKSNLKRLIFRKLEEAASPTKVGRMFYVNFEEHITLKYRVTLLNWPLPKFCSPSVMTTTVEVETVMQCFTTGTTKFYKMTLDEFTKWKEGYLAGKINQQLGDANQSPVQPQEQGPSDEAPDPTPGPSRVEDSLSNPSPDQAQQPSLQSPVCTQPQSRFVNSMAVTGSDGSVLRIAAKPRRQRKDKGQPRKKNVQVGGTA